MVRAFKRLIGTVAVLLLITGCQAMTGETMGQNIDDGAITSSVKTQLRQISLSPCHVWVSKPTMGLFI